MIKENHRIPSGIALGFSFVTVLFLILYVLLSYHSRPAADDFYFLSSVHEHGNPEHYVGSIPEMDYPLDSHFIPGAAVKIFHPGESLVWFQIFTLISLWLGVVFLLRNIIKTNLSIFIYVLFALLQVFTFFMLCLDPGESWFWLTSECMYLWPVIALVWASSFMAGNPRYYFIPVVLFVFIGGASEVIALETILIIVFMLVYSNRAGLLPKPTLYLSLGPILISLFIAWLGTGRLIRQTSLPDVSFLNQGILAIKASVYFLLARLPVKAHWIFFFTIPWMWIGFILRPDRTTDVGNEDGKIREVFASVARYAVYFLVFVFIHFAITVFLLKSFPPARTWITISVALGIVVALTGIRLGGIVNLSLLKFLSIVYILVCSVVLIYTISTQSAMTSAYTKAYDNRMKFLSAIPSDQTAPVEVEPLPEPGMLYSAEISSNTSDFRNRLLQNYLQLKTPLQKK